MAQTFQVVDLFAGSGGITTGFHLTERYRTVGAVEMNLSAATTYAENFGKDIIHCGDVSEWKPEDAAAEADVVVGGPPCQGFSNLGAKRIDDERNQLWREYVRVLNQITPKVFVIENVDRFLKTGEFEALRSEATPGGLLQDYKLRSAVVNAADYGSAQLRRRTIVIGTHRDLTPIEIPVPTVSPGNRRTVRQALHDLPLHVAEDNQFLPEGTVDHHGKPVPGAFSGLTLHLTRKYEPISRERFLKIPEGGNRFDLPDHLKSPCWLKHTSGSGDVMGRLRWEKPSVTIRTEFFKPEKGRYLHPTEHRALTHLEAARIQGFPDDFRWCGSKVQIARQIGNAVPVELSEAIGRHVATSLDTRL
jgi:DNA (cytosine-5)-methyltransferase 1